MYFPEYTFFTTDTTHFRSFLITDDVENVHDIVQ